MQPAPATAPAPANDNSPPTRPVSFDARVMAYAPGLSKLAYRLGARGEERGNLVTDTIIETLEKWQNFREDGGMWSWLYWTMRGHFTNQKNLKRVQIVEAESPYYGAFVLPRQEQNVELANVLDMLPKGRSGAVLLRRAMGEQLNEIGADYGISRERVRQIEETARTMVRKRAGLLPQVAA